MQAKRLHGAKNGKNHSHMKQRNSSILIASHYCTSALYVQLGYPIGQLTPNPLSRLLPSVFPSVITCQHRPLKYVNVPFAKPQSVGCETSCKDVSPYHYGQIKITSFCHRARRSHEAGSRTCWTRRIKGLDSKNGDNSNQDRGLSMRVKC